MEYMHSPVTFVLYCFSGLGFNFTVVERFCLLNTVCARLNANGTTFIASVAVGQTSLTSTISCCNTNGCNKNNFDGKLIHLTQCFDQNIITKIREEQYLDLYI